jgi:hypothetical protein
MTSRPPGQTQREAPHLKGSVHETDTQTHVHTHTHTHTRRSTRRWGRHWVAPTRHLLRVTTRVVCVTRGETASRLVFKRPALRSTSSLAEMKAQCTLHAGLGRAEPKTHAAAGRLVREPDDKAARPAAQARARSFSLSRSRTRFSLSFLSLVRSRLPLGLQHCTLGTSSLRRVIHHPPLIRSNYPPLIRSNYPLCFVSFRFVSFRFVSFRFVSFRFCASGI